MSHKSLHPFRALLASELRQLWRSPLPWLLVVAVPVVFVLVGEWQAPALERLVQMRQPLTVLGVALGALAAWTWQRGRRSGSDEILLAWPLPSWQVGLARTLALSSLTLVCWLEATLPSLVYTAVSYATAARAVGVALPMGQALHDGGLIVLSLAASFLGAQALGQIAGALLPGLAALALLIMYRAAVLTVPGTVLEFLQWPYGLLASPEYQWDGERLASGLQANVHTGLYLAHQAFWVLGSLGLLALVVLLFRPHRDTPRLRSTLLAGAALLVVVGAALPLIAQESNYVASQRRTVAEYGPPLPPTEAPDAPEQPRPASEAPVPLSYNLAVDLTRPPLAQVQATVELQALSAAPLDVLTLTLRREFQIDTVSFDGATVPAGQWQQEDDLLRIRPDTPVTPGQTMTVTVTYHGRVEDWRLAPYELAALAGRDVVFLPASWGWYPVPGEQPLNWVIEQAHRPYIVDRMQPFNNAEPAFDVTVHAPSGITDLTGFAQEQDGSWHLAEKRNSVNLLGGPWWEKTQDGVEYAVPFEELDTWQADNAELQRLLVPAQDWTGITLLAVVPAPAPLDPMNDHALLDENEYGELARFGLSRDAALARLGLWVHNLMIVPVHNAPTATQAFYTSDDLQALRALVTTRVMTDAYGSEDAAKALQLPDEMQHSAPVDAWAARTPLAAQKEALRRIIGISRLRPLTPADLAFLNDGGGQP